MDDESKIEQQTDANPLDLLAVKLADDEGRVIEGYASLWGVKDYQGEVMERTAIEPYLDEYLRNGPLHWQHGKDAEVGLDPIGKVLEARCDDTGLWIRAQIYKGTKAAEKAWALIKQGVRGLSVGAMERVIRAGIIKAWRLIEISVTHMPAVAGATFSIANALALAKAANCELDPQMSRIESVLADLEQRSAQASGAYKAHWQKALDAYRAALDSDDQAKADQIYTEAQQENQTMEDKELQASIAKTVADALAQMKAAEAEATAKAEAEAKRVDELAAKKADELLQAKVASNPALKRAMYATEADSQPADQGIMRGPYDDVEPVDLALAYLAAKAGQPFTLRRPGQELYRALHGKTLDKIAKGGWAQKSLSLGGEPLYISAKKDHELYTLLRKNSPDVLYAKADELMGSDVANQGDEWIPQMFSRELIPLIRNEAVVQNLFRAVEVTGESLTIPTQDGTVTWYKTAQADDVAEMAYDNAYITARATNVNTGNLTLTPAKLSALLFWTGELNDQSLVAQAPFYREEFVKSGREVIDELLISGDETTTSANISDYGNAAISTAWRLLTFDGLRHMAIAASNNASVAALTAEDFLALKKLMGTNGKYALQPGKLVWIMDPAVYYKALALGEAITMDKAGGYATFQNGVIERIFGSPVIASDQFAATDSSGYINNTGGSNTLGSILCVRPDQMVIGWGRRMTVEVQRVARADAYEIVAHMMIDFGTATTDAAALGYNVTV